MRILAYFNLHILAHTHETATEVTFKAGQFIVKLGRKRWKHQFAALNRNRRQLEDHLSKISHIFVLQRQQYAVFTALAASMTLSLGGSTWSLVHYLNENQIRTFQTATKTGAEFKIWISKERIFWNSRTDSVSGRKPYFSNWKADSSCTQVTMLA